MSSNRQIVLVERPQGKLTPAHFEGRDGEMPTAGAGEAVVRAFGLATVSVEAGLLLAIEGSLLTGRIIATHWVISPRNQSFFVY